MPEKKTFQKRTHLKNLHRIWKQATSDKYKELQSEEKSIAEIMLQHPEYHDQFAMADKLADREYDPNDVNDPFVHIDIHLAIQGQLDSGEPVDTEIFIETMEAKGISRHEAIHCAGMILTKTMHETVQKLGYFEVYKYKELLNRLKDVEPADLETVLEREF
ncbi:MAG: DUF1841 family protein [Deltaproteobacteria bacterium]|nr:DUF1841 family protein [Deltaproteobacteria bacterium]